ncbi:outer membrane lipoprotein chaperone LolA [Candidatus Marithrix sp. Canyon 246]|uniref:outer membrane lipoprotein chaperone LolA n=2 Tax=Candidatus Marithrix sp. Canyon 246 TaxID=1827136 RepID=UPI0009F52693|nr:outer membrane lipoprotein chaperone LolA [Candidatus Marithrix sp. Canyon 246]
METMKNSLLLILVLAPNLLHAEDFLNRYLGNLATFQANFEQRIYNDNGTLLEKSSGKMYVQRPNKFRWVYEKPYSQLIVADGERVWIYDNDLDQVTVKNMNKALGKTPAFLLSSNRKVNKDFRVRQIAYTRKAFELTPKDKQAAFKKIRIKFNKYNSLKGFELLDNLDQKSYISFRRVKKNKRMDQGLFIFTPPAGSDIIYEE